MKLSEHSFWRPNWGTTLMPAPGRHADNPVFNSGFLRDAILESVDESLPYKPQEVVINVSYKDYAGLVAGAVEVPEGVSCQRLRGILKIQIGRSLATIGCSEF